MQLFHLHAGCDSALSNPQHVVGDQRAEFHCRVEVHLKSAQVAAIHTDDIRPAFQRALQFILVVYLAEHVQFQCSSALQQVPESSVIQGGKNEENGVGAAGPGFQDLEIVNDEVLAQAGQIGSG